MNEDKLKKLYRGFSLVACVALATILVFTALAFLNIVSEHTTLVVCLIMFFVVLIGWGGMLIADTTLFKQKNDLCRQTLHNLCHQNLIKLLTTSPEEAAKADKDALHYELVVVGNSLRGAMGMNPYPGMKPNRNNELYIQGSTGKYLREDLIHFPANHLFIGNTIYKRLKDELGVDIKHTNFNGTVCYVYDDGSEMQRGMSIVSKHPLDERIVGSYSNCGFTSNSEHDYYYKNGNTYYKREMCADGVDVANHFLFIKKANNGVAR